MKKLSITSIHFFVDICKIKISEQIQIRHFELNSKILHFDDSMNALTEFLADRRFGGFLGGTPIRCSETLLPSRTQRDLKSVEEFDELPSLEVIPAWHEAMPGDGLVGLTVVFLHQQPMKCPLWDDEKPVRRAILGGNQAQEMASARINLKRAKTAHFSREIFADSI